MAKAANYEHLKQSEITVYGMTCEHCVKHVTKALEKLQGVENVVVSLNDGKAIFSHDSTRVGMDDVNRAIEEAGYFFKPIPPEGSDESSAEDGAVKESASAKATMGEAGGKSSPDGTDAELKRQFKISGMTCANCALTIEKAWVKCKG